jgi:hypothetical protein
MNKFTVKEEMGIIQARFYGETKLESFEEYFQVLGQMELPAKIKILHDHREATPGMSPAELGALTDLLTKYLSKFEEVRIAYVSASPRAIALAMLLKDQLSTVKMKTEIFSEMEIAIKWLNMYS